MRPENVNSHLEQVIQRHADDLARGAFISVTEGQWRVRRLSIGGQG